MERYNFNRSARFDRIYANDELRPMLNNVLFEGGNIIATDGTMLLCADMNEVSNISDEDISKLNGKMMYRTNFALMLKYRNLYKIENDGVIVCNTNDDIVKILFSNMVGEYPNYKDLLDLKINNKQWLRSFDPTKVELLTNCVGSRFCKLTLTERNIFKVEFPDVNASGVVCGVDTDWMVKQ